MFKEGDRVKVRKACSGSVPGIIYLLRPKSRGGNILRAYDPVNERGCSCETNWIKVVDLNVRELNKSIIKTPKIKKAEVITPKIVEAKPKI